MSLEGLEKPGFTPIGLIRYLEEKGIFQDKPFQEGQILPLEVEIDNNRMKEIPSVSLLESKIDLLSTLLYACFNHIEITAPIWIYGTENETFDFLDKLFFILSKRVWSNLSFNTFWYEDPKLPGLFFCCNSLKSSEIRLPNYSLKIDLMQGSYDSKIDISDKAIYEYAKLAAQKALNNESSLSILYSLQEFAETVDWVRFVEMFKDAPQDIKTIIYNLHKERIITEVSQGNAKLFRILENAEHNKVFKSKGLINHIIENHDEILAKDFVGWFYDLPSMEDKRDLYFVFLSNPWLLNLLLDNIRGDKIRISRSAEMIQELIEDIGKMAAEKEGYNEATEERLLEGLYEFLDNKPNIDTSRALKIIKKLPATKNPKILLLRVLIRYEIGDNSEFISLIKEEDYKQLIQDLTKGGLKAIDWEKHKKAFQEIKPKSFFRWIL